MTYSKIEKYVESIFITLAAILIGFYTSPNDPLLVHAAFPWIWIIPMLIALRHGRIAALISIILVVMAILYSTTALLFSWDAYRVWLFGGITLTFICAEYHAMWQRRHHQLYVKEDYLDTRLESLSRVYSVLRLSHDRLEESLILKPVSLREAFLQLRELLLKNQGQFSPQIAQSYLALLAYHTNIDQGALYLKEGQSFSLTPIAHLRYQEPLNLNDILVKRALHDKKTSFVAVNLLEENELSAYLAVLPMITADDEVIGLLTITDMPFMSLNNESLTTLSALLAYIADEHEAASHANQIQVSYPDCPAYFSSELFKLAHLYKIAKLDSSLFTFYVSQHRKKEDILQLLHQEKRGLDIIWQTERGENTQFFLLMPLTERSMIKGYLDRMNGIFKKIDVQIDTPPLHVQYRQISNYPSINHLLDDLIHDYPV